MIRFIKTLRNDHNGTSAIEFALITPMLFVMMLGTLQMGLWMHGYNGLRTVAAEASRHATVQYQRGNRMTNFQVADWARTHARRSASILNGGTVSTSVIDDANQNIPGVTRKTLTVNYRLASFMGMIGIEALNLSFSRPIFVKAA